MIDALQTELESTKAQLERAKGEVRNCRREIGTVGCVDHVGGDELPR